VPPFQPWMPQIVPPETPEQLQTLVPLEIFEKRTVPYVPPYYPPKPPRN
jgi:hypothetical protein